MARIIRMERALSQFVVQDIETSIPLHQSIFQDEDFRAGKFDTKFMERFLAKQPLRPGDCQSIYDEVRGHDANPRYQFDPEGRSPLTVTTCQNWLGSI